MYRYADIFFFFSPKHNSFGIPTIFPLQCCRTAQEESNTFSMVTDSIASIYNVLCGYEKDTLAALKRWTAILLL